MGGRKEKQKKIATIGTFSNVYQNHDFREAFMFNSVGEQLDVKGKWDELIFKNTQPITLELACGKGEYTVNLAEKYPDRNFIGIDYKGARIFTGAQQALEKDRKNVAFARMRIENITNFFAPNEVDEIWITFPDPFPKDRHEKHRLTHINFLKRYKQILKPNGIIQLKTDDIDLFRYTRSVIDEHKLNLLYYKEDIYSAPLDFDVLEIKTFYEKQFLAQGKAINYLRFTLP
ncbi:MAG TPA: tRNA (guanosine(46)-N7)-methyltransferase TrmB [Chitinophagales bacterium]